MNGNGHDKKEMHEYTDSELMPVFAQELAMLQGNITVNMPKQIAWQICSQIQLACRHPRNKSQGRQAAEKFAREIMTSIGKTPALKEAARRGWEPGNDWVDYLDNEARG